MTSEEKNIKNKIDTLTDIDVFFNDSHLWERVEARLDQKKNRKSLVVWYWVAAGTVIISLLFYFSLSTTTTRQKNIAMTKNTATSIPQLKPEITVQTRSYTPKIPVAKKNVVKTITVKDSIQDNRMQGKLQLSDVTQLNPINKTLISGNAKDLSQQPIVFKAQRVTTLDLPIIPDEMMQRESFAKRALRQVRNFGSEGKVDLRELNIEPRNVWAYLERSFFHDTTKITTTKTLKQ